MRKTTTPLEIYTSFLHSLQALLPKVPDFRPFRIPYTARAITRACEKADVPSWHPHQLRHNAGTYLRKEFGLDVARIILGHRSADTTELYAELDREKAIEAMLKSG